MTLVITEDWGGGGRENDKPEDFNGFPRHPAGPVYQQFFQLTLHIITWPKVLINLDSQLFLFWPFSSSEFVVYGSRLHHMMFKGPGSLSTFKSVNKQFDLIAVYQYTNCTCLTAVASFHVPVNNCLLYGFRPASQYKSVVLKQTFLLLFLHVISQCY